MKNSTILLNAVNPFRAASLLFALAAFTTVANAGVFAVDNGQLVVDSSINVTWAADGNLFSTLATQSGNVSSFVNTVISDSGGQVGAYTLTAADFHTGAGQLGQMDWYAAVAWINYLNKTSYLGFSTWRMPTTVNASTSATDTPDPSSSEMAELILSELGGPVGVDGSSILDTHNANFKLFTNFQAYLYWSGTEYFKNNNAAWSFNALVGEDSQDFNAKNNFFDVLPLLDGQVGATATPEPSSALLIATGLAGFSGFVMRRRSASR